MTGHPVRYVSQDDDNARWLGFPFRRGDIVISARSKSGTTWMQMICALLVFRTTDLPRPLSVLSPWLDWKGTPLEQVVAELEAQTHRRFIKTHTPLDGLPMDERATYIVVARHPLDMAVSLYHQGTNLDRRRIGELTGADAPLAPEPPPPLLDWLRAWIEWDGSHTERLDSLPGVMWHVSDAWERRGVDNIVLVHYDDLIADLEGRCEGLPPFWASRSMRTSLGRWLEQQSSRQCGRGADPLLPTPAAFSRAGWHSFAAAHRERGPNC